MHITLSRLAAREHTTGRRERSVPAQAGDALDAAGRHARERARVHASLLALPGSDRKHGRA